MRISRIIDSASCNEQELSELLASEITADDLDTFFSNFLFNSVNNEQFEEKVKILQKLFQGGIKPTEKWLRSALLHVIIAKEATLRTTEEERLRQLEKIDKYQKIVTLLLEYMQGTIFATPADDIPILHRGIQTNNPDIVQRLITLGAQVNEINHYGGMSNKSGITPLMQAAIIGNTEIAEQLLKAGAEVDYTYEDNIQVNYLVKVRTGSRVAHSALSVAASCGNEAVVKQLLAVNPSPEQLAMALICAIFSGNDKLIELLRDAGASFCFDATNQTHLECLYGTVLQGCVMGLDYLISVGLRFDEKQAKNIVYYAMQRKTPDMISKLQECGGTLIMDAIEAAARCGDTECFLYLRDKLPAPTTDELNEMLRNAPQYASELLQMGADPHTAANSWDTEGDSLIKSVCSNNNLENDVVRILIESALQIHPLKSHELSEIYSSLIYRNMLDELKLVYKACGGFQALQSAVEDYSIADVVRNRKTGIIRFLLDNGVTLSPLYTLREAVDIQDIECVKLSLEARGDIPVSSKTLCDAIEARFDEAVALMLTHGVNNLNSRDFYQNPLCRAISCKNAICTEMLLKAGSDINTRDEYKEDDFIVARAAVEVNDVATLSTLIERGLQINEDNDSLLRAAACAGAADCLKLLLPLIKTPRTEILCKCVSLERPDIISLLLEAGADVKTKREIISGPFHTEKRPPLLACIAGNESINKDRERESVELLLKAGGRVNDRVENPYHSEYKYKTCLGEAIKRYCSTDSIAVLLDNGAEVNRPANKLEETPLMLAAATGQARVVELLLKAGADVNTISSKGATALMLAAESGFPQIVSRLIESGADVQAKDYNEKDAFMYALQNRNLRSAEVLLAAGLVPAALSTISAPYFPMVDEVLEMLRRNNVAEEGIARLLGSLLPAVVSVKKPDAELIKKLTEYGANVNATDEKGNTALLVAAANCCSGTIIKAILAAGADPRITGSKGENAVQIAQKSHCAAGIITALEKAIAKIEKAEAKAAEKAAKAKEKAAKSAKKKK